MPEYTMNDLARQRLREMLARRVCTNLKNIDSYLKIAFGPSMVIVYAAWRAVQGEELTVGSGSAGKVGDKLRGTMAVAAIIQWKLPEGSPTYG